jgi:3-deoxy-manno-octulosonate cytidylyltransferase (CMP-KDO synthetase)
VINKNKKNKDFIIIIPARLNSKRLTKKLLRRICNVPMIIRVARAAKEINFADVLVATDSIQILNLCKKNNFKTLLTPSSLKSGTDRVHAAYKILQRNYKLIINLQGDLPLFEKNMFDKVVDLFKDSKTDIGSAVCGLEKDEYKDTNVVKAKAQLNKKGEGFATNFCRKIKNSEGYYHHIGVYVYKPSVLEKFIKLQPTKNEYDLKLEQMRAIDNNINIKVVRIENNPPSVDTFEDLQKIRLLFKKKKY